MLTDSKLRREKSRSVGIDIISMMASHLWYQMKITLYDFGTSKDLFWIYSLKNALTQKIGSKGCITISKQYKLYDQEVHE